MSQPINFRYTSTSDVQIQVKDLEAARKFYAGVLKLPVVHESDNLIGFNSGSFTLFVSTGDVPGPVFEFKIPDIHKAKERLLRAGCSVVRSDGEHQWMQDPNGLIFNLTEKTDDISQAEVLQFVTDRVNDVRKFDPLKGWDQMVTELAKCGIQCEFLKTGVEIEEADPQIALEQLYQDLQNQLIQIRHAVAQAIATEKQMETTLQRNFDQAKLWEERRDALMQNNEDLANQAGARRAQYLKSAEQLGPQLTKQRKITETMRERLTNLESEVQRAHSAKQVLTARYKAASASIKLSELMKGVDISTMMSEFAHFEDLLSEDERQVQDDDEDSVDAPSTEALLNRTLAALNRSTNAIEKLEKLLRDNRRDK